MMQMQFRLLPLLLGVLLLTGCRPKTMNLPSSVQSLPDAYIHGGDVSMSPDEGPWWLSLQDDTLNSLMQKCFEGNLDLAMAIKRHEQVAARRDAMHANFWPTLRLNGRTDRRQLASFGDGSSFSSAFTGSGTGSSSFDGVGATTNSINGDLAGAYEVDVWGRLSAQRRDASREWQASTEDLHAVALSLSADLATFYYQAVELRNNLSLTNSTIASYTQSVEVVDARYRAGLVSIIDLHQARQNLARVQAQKPVFEQQLLQTNHAISVLLGDYPRPDSSGTATAWPTLSVDQAVGVPSQLLVRRPDLQAAWRRMQAADARLAVAVRDQFPTLQLTGSYGGRDSVLSELLDAENILWNVAAGLTAPLFEGGRRRAEVRRSNAELEELLLQYTKQVLNAFVEVENTLVATRTLDEQVKWLRARGQFLEQNVNTALAEYRNGLSNYLQVLSAQQAAFDVNVQINAAYRERVFNRIQLMRALGGSWMSEWVQANSSSSNTKVEPTSREDGKNS